MSNITDEHVSYVGRYGGTCRDCADENGVCPSSGLPCAESKKAIWYVLRALDYGVTHGYIANPFAATPQQPAQAELLQALVAATDLLHGTVKSSDRPSDYVMRAVAGFRALIAKAAAIQAPEAAPAQAPVLSEERKPMDDDVIVDIGRCFSTSNDYEGGNCVRLHFNRDELIAFARALLSTNPKSEPAAASPAPAHDLMGQLIKAQEQRDELRQALEVIALGDAADPVRDSGDTLVELGWWSGEALTASRAATQAPAAAHEPAASDRDARYAELGRIAMQFVDRAGDVHPGIDGAEKICADFYAAMSAAAKEAK